MQIISLVANIWAKLMKIEVKAAVWDCDNFKCPGPDEITFGFIKDFWDILKEDMMRFFGGIS